tara:strand:+ start:581 stop:784 length:204 start_codon:yes stop_codon:yes gene_type:complete
MTKLTLFGREPLIKDSLKPYKVVADEGLHNENFLGILLTIFYFNAKDTSQVIEAFRKVWSNLDQLKR